MDQIAIPQTCSGHGRCSQDTGHVNPTTSIRRASPIAVAVLAALLALSSQAACGSGLGDGASEGTDGAAGGDDGGDDGDGAGDGSSPPPGAEVECGDADDCVAVASTCCECPTFAVPVGSGFDEGCSRVECGGDEPTGCAAVEAACVDARCQLVCEPVDATRTCALGFARDGFGCLLDACREDAPDELLACAADGDCTQVQADCCGCERGGADTAVATAAVDDYIDSLACDPQPRCPEVPVCDASLVPRCIAQACTLAPGDDGGSDDGDGGDGDGGDGESPGGEGDLCGVPGYTSCQAGLMCVLNHPDGGDATDIGVGTCRGA
jgi:hypothetical protein